MTVEAQEMIESYYDNLNGSRELAGLFRRYLDPSKRKIESVNLIEITNLDKKIKLKHMHNTWDFTRPFPLFIRMCETFFCIFIS